MPIYALLVLIGLNLVVLIGFKLWQAWDRADILSEIRKAYDEGRRKMILG